MTEPLLARWSAQQADASFSDPAGFGDRLTQFERLVRRRNLVEYIAGAITIPVLASIAWLTAREGAIVIPLGFGLAIAGIIVVLASLFYRAGNLPARPELDCRSHLRAQLVHQRAALEAVPLWYLGPLVPGMAVILIGSVSPVARESGWSTALAGLLPVAALVVGFFGLIWWLNHRAAQQLGRKIEAIDACDSEQNSQR